MNWNKLLRFFSTNKMSLQDAHLESLFVKNDNDLNNNIDNVGADMAKRKKKSPYVKKMQPTPAVVDVVENQELDRWMACDVDKLTTAQICEGIVLLNKAIEANEQLGLDEIVVQQRSRVIDLLEKWLNDSNDSPEWVAISHEQYLRQVGLACDRIANFSKSNDDVKAIEYWAKGAGFFEALLKTYPEQPEWISIFHQNHLREGGIACDRIANSAKDNDDVKAIEYWAKGAGFFEALLKTYPEQPEWINIFHQNHLREGGLACDRIANSAKDNDDVKAIEYWAKGAGFFEALLKTYPEQPEWISVFHQNHLREGELALDCIATKAKNYD